jgi:hypothetical protein
MKASYGAAVVALSGLASCSFMVMGLGEPTPGRPDTVCTSSSAPPLIDIGLTLVYAGVFLMAPVAYTSDSNPDAGVSDEGDGVMAASAILTVTHALSAVHGTVSAAQCPARRRAARESLSARPSTTARLEMWCTQTPTRAVCSKTEGHCDRLRLELSPDGGAPLCEAAEPVCFRVDGALRVCAPDFGSCARERAVYEARAPGTHSLSGCAR